LRGPEGVIYEKRVLEEWMLTNKAWPNSSTPIGAPLAEVDREVKEQAKQFSRRAIEVLQNCIRRNVQREDAVALAAECLGVLNANSDLNEFVGVLQECSRDERAAVLGSFKRFRPSLLRKLLLNVAPMPNQCGLTLVVTDVLEEAQLKSKKVRAKGFISTLKRTWRVSTQRQLSALMRVVLGRLYAKIKTREQAEDCLDETKFAQKPEVTELSEFYGGLGDQKYLSVQHAAPPAAHPCRLFKKRVQTSKAVLPKVLEDNERNPPRFWILQRSTKMLLVYPAITKGFGRAN
jgi:hypothetical protein